MILFVVSFALGIAAEEFFSFDYGIGLFIFLLSGIISIIIWKQNLKLAKIFLLVGIAFSFGILRMSLVDNNPDPNILKFISNQISFEGIVSNEPDERDTSIRYIFHPDSSKSLVLLVAERFPEFKYGDKIRVTGKLDQPKNFITENGTEFDYISYLMKDKIHFIIYHPKIELVARSNTKIVSTLYNFKNNFIKNIEQVVPEPSASFLGGIIFGAKQSLGTDILDQFKKVGLIHVVVLSGQNLTLIALGIMFLVSYLGKRKLGFVFSIIILVLFSIMVGLTATVLRALIMSLIALLARYLGRPRDALRWLFTAGFLMLMWNPLTLTHDPSFQLSFMATLGLILFSQIIYEFLSRKLPFITTKFGIRETVASTFAVQLFILPLLIRMSGSVSVISFLINPLVLPIIPWLMGLGVLTGAFGFFVPPVSFLAWPFGIVSHLITLFIIKIVEFSSQIPFASISISSLPLSIIFIWYLAYAILFYRITLLPRKNYFQPLPSLD